MFIPEDIIQKIKDENDIVDIISESVRLKRSGRNYIGLCPFHNEKTPSFTVSADKQIFKCFGCGEAGNVITFIMKTRNLTFPEACEVLAHRANIEITSTGNTKIRDNKRKLYSLNVDVARYFFRNLKNNKNVILYLNKRGLSGKTIGKFGIGYSLDSWTSLYKYLKNKGYSEQEMLSIGLILKGKNNKYYDRFRNRVMFPVFNVTGKVIGFGGRVLDDSKPKYLNSPESSIFDKGANLYGLNFAIKNNKNDSFIMVEGYMDCISLQQAEITNVVASLGTALTIGQAKLMKRYVNKIYIAYDSDAAGKAATLRSLDILLKEELDVRIVLIPDGKDPDDYVKKHGKDGFFELLKNALPLVQYKIKIAEEKTNFNDEKSLSTFITEISEILISLDPVERNLYIKKISEETNIDEEAIYDFLNEKLQKSVKIKVNMNIKEKVGTKLYLEEPYMKAERTLLKLMLNKNYMGYIISLVNVETIINNTHKNIFNLIVQNKELDKDKLKKKIELLCQDVDMAREWINVDEIKILPLDGEESKKQFVEDCLKEIEKWKLQKLRKDITDKIKQYEKNGNFQESLKYVEELSKVDEKLRIL